MTSGPATHAELQELHRLLVRSLIERLEATPNAELLQVGRAVLRDNGLAGRASDGRDVEQLHTLYDLLVQRLSEALREPAPPTAVLAVVRQFLRQQAVSKDLGAAIDPAAAMQDLADLDLPFTNH